MNASTEIAPGIVTIVIGTARYLAAKNLGLTRIPTLCLEHLTPEQLRAYRLAEQRLAEQSGWDELELALELSELADLDLDFDLEITGFETADIDRLTLLPPGSGHDPADDIPAAPANPVARPGDLFALGEHRLYCGNALDAASYAALMADERARMVFSDPPYNVPIMGHVSGLGNVRHREFAMASGEMQPAVFTSFLETTFEHCVSVSLPGAIHFHCMDWRHQPEMLAAGAAIYSELKQFIVWVKDNGGMGAFYRSQHELIKVWKVGTASHVRENRRTSRLTGAQRSPDRTCLR